MRVLFDFFINIARWACIHTVLRKRCSSNITLNGLVGPELFNRHLKAVENLDGFFLSDIF